MSYYIVQKSDGIYKGAVLTESLTMSRDPANWWLFDSATEATLTSFGLPFPTEVHIVGAERDCIATDQNIRIN